MEEDDGPVYEKFLTIVGDRRPTISEIGVSTGEYPNLLLGGVCIGPCFHMIGDTVSLQFLEVSDKCKSVTGYSSQEIKQTGWDFHFQFMHQDDVDHCLQLIQLAWEYLNRLPGTLKKDYVCSFYYRGLKKDGTIIKIQHQVVNFELDKNKIITKAYILMTDVSHLDIPDTVKLSMMNPITNSFFSANASNTGFTPDIGLLSKREKTILQLMIEGFSSYEIGDKLFISFHTVRTHRKNILK